MRALFVLLCVVVMGLVGTPMAPVWAQTDLISLRDAVAAGVNNNPQYGSIVNNRRATDEELRQAKGLFYPSVDITGDTGLERTDSPTTRATRNDDRTFGRYQVGMTLTQLLFDGFNAWYEVERQRERVLSASHRTREVVEFIGLDVVESYLDVLRQREILDYARTNVEKHIEIQAQIRDGASAGRSTDADVAQADARLAAAKALESNVRQALRIAESRYARSVGEMPKTLQRPNAPVSVLSADVDQQVQQTLTQSPTLDVFEADINVARAEQEQSKSTFYPQFNLQMGANTGRDLGGVEDEVHNASALVRMNWNVFRGGIDTARVREQVYRTAQIKEDRANAGRAVEDDTRQTWARMVSEGERAKEFRAQAEANDKVVSAYLDQFNLDRRTLLDVLDAQNEWFVSRTNTINSEYLELFSMHRLLALTGKLLPTLEVAYPTGTDAKDNYR